MKKTKLFIFTLLIGLASLLSACSSASTNSGQETPKQSPEKTASSKLDEIKSKGVIRVGATTTGTPFTFLDTKTSQIQGVMVDVAHKLSEHLGVKVEIQETKFSALVPSIESDKIDVISAGMLMTPERAEVIDFSNPVYRYGEGLVVAMDNDSIKKFEDLKGKKVGAQEGTIFLKNLKEHTDISVQSYKAMSDMIVELKNGRIDAFLADYPVMVHMINENKDLNVKLVKGYETQWAGDVGIGMSKGQADLQKAINDAIETMKKNGELDEILKKWGL
ncbi:ABC transporter substrate-binding protein [Ammoniphilus sp. YIM 78166]|uniref:substrate-binding periplasmic protein n=1 Tax=Ammoniphilus sp. YIM 78166 TaxID=1644106 RepID=UPI00142FECB9|nr:ABC transporter substrate-binding protein [Ammoniphilus sp. YIM 78166]